MCIGFKAKTFLDIILQPKGVRLFLGLTDTEKEGRWRWQSTGALARYTKFQPGEPNGGTSENCVIIGQDKGLWADVCCFTNLNYHICEKPAGKHSPHHLPVGNNFTIKFDYFFYWGLLIAKRVIKNRWQQNAWAFGIFERY